MRARLGPSAADVIPNGGAGRIKVWDPVVRLFHWTVVLGCIVNLIRDDGDAVHRWLGYSVAAAIAIRLSWGFVARGHARFSSFVPRPSTLWNYAEQLLHRREPRYVGHNPAGAVMMMALVGLLIGVSVTGWMMGLDRFWGNEMLQEVHEFFANAILVLAVMHVAAALFESRRHHENLIKAMITGYKRKPGGTDIDNATDPG